MNTMSTIERLKGVLLSMLLLLFAGNANAGVPVTGLLICCRGTDLGPFLINGKWNSSHDYNDIEQVRGILRNIQHAGINVVCIDMTNPSQWGRLWDQFRPMIENIRAVCAEQKMEYFIMIGGIVSSTVRGEEKIPASMGDLEYWNGKAKIIWDNWAEDSHYRAYGFGDNRKILNIFYPHQLYNPIWESGADTNKTYLSKFYLGTHQYNQRFVDGPIDGWGYRDKQQNASGTIRFVCPSEGLHPTTSKRISAQQWKDRVDWASQAEHYSIYGSYDDTCDSIQWGIQDTKNTRPGSKKNPTDDPFMYYNVVKNKLAPNNPLPKTGVEK